MQLEFITIAQNQFVQLVRKLKAAVKRCRRDDDPKLQDAVKQMEKLCEEFGRAQALSPGASPQGLKSTVEALNAVTKLAGRLALGALDADMVNYKELYAAYFCANQLGELLRNHLNRMLNWHRHSGRRHWGIRVTRPGRTLEAPETEATDKAG